MFPRNARAGRAASAPGFGGPSRAGSALAAEGTLLSITLHAPPAEQVALLSRLSCLSTAVQRAAQPVWRELCFARWPSSRALVDVTQPRAWRALALARSADEVPRLKRRVLLGAPWKSEDLLPFVSEKQPLLLLDVSVSEGVLFSARLSSGENDCVLRFSDAPCQADGIIADDDEPADEFAEAHQQLHLIGGNSLPSFPQRLLLLHSSATNELPEPVCLIDNELDVWNGDAEDDAEVRSGSQDVLINAQLCVVHLDGKVAVLDLGYPTPDRDVPAIFGSDDEADDSAPRYWEKKPCGVLRWARTFAACGSGRRSDAGFDAILNLYCRSTLMDDEGEAAEAPPALEGQPAAPGAAASSSHESCEPESDVSAGDEAVRQVAAERLERLQRLRDALRAHDAERAVLSRQLAECLEGSADGEHPRDLLGDIELAELVPSPRRSDSSQHTQTTASEASSGPQGAPTKHMRLALASLSLGWLPAGDIGAELMREAWAAEHELLLSEVDDERELTESEEKAVQDAEAAHFDAKMPWLRDN